MRNFWPLLLVASAAGIASFYPLTKSLTDVDPYTIALLRSGIAALVLIPVMYYWRSLRLPPTDEWPLILFLAFCTVAPTAFLASGIAHTNSVIAAILMNTQPLLIGLASPFLIAERTSAMKLVAIGIGFVGVVFVIWNGRTPGGVLDDVYLWGILLVMTGACISALNKMYSKRLVLRHDGLYATFFGTVVGSSLLILFLAATGGLGGLAKLDAPEWLAAFLIGTLATAIPWVVWASSLKYLDVQVAASFNLLIPIFAAFYSFLFLDEALTLWIFAGLVLTSIGVYIVQRKAPQPGIVQ